MEKFLFFQFLWRKTYLYLLIQDFDLPKSHLIAILVPYTLLLFQQVFFFGSLYFCIFFFSVSILDVHKNLRFWLATA